MGKFDSLMIGLWGTVATILPASKAFSQETPENIKDTLANTLPVDSTAVVSDTSKNIEYNRADLDHEAIIHSNVDEIMIEYGDSVGREIIRIHRLMEINAMRQKRGLLLLVRNSALEGIAQRKSEDMFLKGSLYKSKDLAIMLGQQFGYAARSIVESIKYIGSNETSTIAEMTKIMEYIYSTNSDIGFGLIGGCKDQLYFTIICAKDMQEIEGLGMGQ